MIKITTTENKELYLWLNAKESGKDKVAVNITISEDLETCKKNMEMVTEHYWHKKLNIPQSILFDGTPKLNDEGVNENELTESVMAILKDKTPFRDGYHGLAETELKLNKSITKAEKLL